jgi:hypothetical protein
MPILVLDINYIVDDFDPAKHPRGQPENAGQFSEAPVAATALKAGAKLKAPVAKPAPASTIPPPQAATQTQAKAQPAPAATAAPVPAQRPPEAPEFFSPAEYQGLPSQPHQPIQGEEDLYAKSAVALDQLQDWLDRGNGVISKMGFTNEAKPDVATLQKPGGQLFIASLKGRERAAEKVMSDYHGDWSRLMDVARCTIAVDTLPELKNVVQKLKDSGMKLAGEPKDKFSRPTDAGYRDLNLRVQLPNGIISEVQVHLKGMLVAKAAGHKMYEVMRTLETKPRNTWTPEEKATYLDNEARSKALYDEAWKNATG